MPSRDAYAYGLSLTEVLFTSKEMASSLLFSSKRSAKPALDRSKVEKLLGMINNTTYIGASTNVLTLLRVGHVGICYVWDMSESVTCGTCRNLLRVGHVGICYVWDMSESVTCGTCRNLLHVGHVGICYVWDMLESVMCGTCWDL